MKILILFFLFPFVLEAECFPVTTKIIFQGKAETAKNQLCKKRTKDGMLFFVSKSCEKDQCEILKRTPKNLIIKKYKDSIGSPGFKLCQELGGVPQIFEFQLDLAKEKKWQTSERCYFEREDFVEISLLTHEWKRFIH